MFKHILVPLDGSRMAEAALPAAAYYAQKLNASITLVHVMERNAPQKVHGERHLSDPAEANGYLAELARHSLPEQLEVKHHVHIHETGDVARSISEHVGELFPDLIVMCAHGRRGARERLYGYLAQQVISLGNTPVLIVQPTTAATPAFQCTKVLVPIDDNPHHEQGLPIAVNLGRACAADLHLLMVVPTLSTLSGEKAATSRLLPRATEELLAQTQRNADDYLRNHLAHLRATALKVTTEVVRGNPADAIVSTALRFGADLIVLGTHGKSGMTAFWSGSVASMVCKQCKLPILLVPVKKLA